MPWRIIWIVALLTASAGTVNAETVAEIFEKFGLLGTWAENCNAPASDSNLHLTYAPLPSGLVSRKYYNGPNAFFEYEVLTAEVSGNKITFDMRNLEPPWREFEVVLVKRGDAVKVWQSTNEWGHSQIMNGKAIDTGIVSNWQRKCR